MMKKLIIALAAVILSAGIASAQDLANATATYNNGAESLQMGQKDDALSYFQQALQQGQALGEEGADLVANCKKAIPGVILSIGKEAFNNKDFAAAIAKFEEAAKVGNEYGETEVAAEAANLVSQAKVAGAYDNASDALKAKNFAGAIAGFQEVLALDPDNKNAALQLGSALGATGKIEEAEAAFAKAVENGAEQTMVNKQVSNLYLKKGASLLKGQKLADAVAAAEKANSIYENAQAYLIIGQASQKLKKNSDAIAAFDKYLGLAPKAKNAGAIAFTIGALYQQDNNKAKAVEYYKKVLTDPKFGAQAKQLVDALSK